MKRIMIQVNDRELETLKTMAKILNVSVSSYIREQLGFDGLTRGRVPKVVEIEASPRPRGRPRKVSAE